MSLNSGHVAASVDEKAVREHFATQAGYCNVLGSPFYGNFLAACGERLSHDTDVGRQILQWRGDPTSDALALRFAGALRFLALTGDEPELAELYSEHRTGVLSDSDWSLIHEVIERRTDTVLEMLSLAVQTNEVGRSFALLAGFLYLADQYRHPLRLFEVGASAGLNMLWDRWRYDAESWQWGNPSARLHFSCDWNGAPLSGHRLLVAGRRACDLSPIDVRSSRQRARLLAYIWPDQAHRIQRTEAAIDEFVKTDYEVETAGAAPWLQVAVPSRSQGELRVIFHSVMWQYLSASARDELTQTIEHHGRRAEVDSPLVWMRLEPAKKRRCAELRVTEWPRGRTQVLAHSDYQGRWIEWHLG